MNWFSLNRGLDFIRRFCLRLTCICMALPYSDCVKVGANVFTHNFNHNPVNVSKMVDNINDIFEKCKFKK
jgi:hypothetical protein